MKKICSICGKGKGVLIKGFDCRGNYILFHLVCLYPRFDRMVIKDVGVE